MPASFVLALGTVMENVEFLEWEELLRLHEDQLGLYGGQAGFIDENTVRSVMARAQFTAQYNEDADLADLAADYMFGFATTQGFMDGNKRTALVAAERFLRKNHWRTLLTTKLMYLVAMAVARGEVDRDELAEILRTHMEELPEE
jgi:death-on-curing protein